MCILWSVVMLGAPIGVPHHGRYEDLAHVAACDAHTCFAFDLAFTSAVGCGDKADVPPFLQARPPHPPMMWCTCHDMKHLHAEEHPQLGL